MRDVRKDTYLGDGVYASCDGFHIVLDLRAQGPDRIALEPSVFRSLVDYARAIERDADNPGFWTGEKK